MDEHGSLSRSVSECAVFSGAIGRVQVRKALKEALANNHRYKPEPLFSKTGTGSLSSATTEECAKEIARSTERIRKVLRPSARNENKNGG
jgi:hypothetical protein